jgi:S-adenosylmethionine/arginine decarboxylase-like enzyme
MTPSEIITEDQKRFGHSQKDTDRLLETMVALVHQKGAQVIKFNNSVLFIINLGHGAGEINFFTCDTPQKVKSAMAHFIKQVKNGGFTKVYGEDGGPILNKTLKLLTSLGLKVKDSNIPRYKWMADL